MPTGDQPAVPTRVHRRLTESHVLGVSGLFLVPAALAAAGAAWSEPVIMGIALLAGRLQPL